MWAIGVTVLARETDIRVIKTKRAIRDAVLSLLNDHDPREITVREVADVAYINRRTFFAHYDSVLEVVDEVEDEAAAEVIRVLEEGDVSTLRGVYSIIRKIYAMSKDPSTTFGKVIGTSARYGTSNKLRSIMSSRLLERFSSKEEGGSAAAGADDARLERNAYLSDYIAGGIVALTMRWLTRKDGMSTEETEEVSSLTYDLLVEGLKRLRASHEVALQQ